METLFKKLSSTKLTRKEFLFYMGTLVLGILGVSSVLKLLSEVNPRPSKLSNKHQTNGFGSGAYGA